MTTTDVSPFLYNLKLQLYTNGLRSLQRTISLKLITIKMSNYIVLPLTYVSYSPPTSFTLFFWDFNVYTYLQPLNSLTTIQILNPFKTLLYTLPSNSKETYIFIAPQTTSFASVPKITYTWNDTLIFPHSACWLKTKINTMLEIFLIISKSHNQHIGHSLLETSKHLVKNKTSYQTKIKGLK